MIQDIESNDLAAELLRRILPASEHDKLDGESMRRTPERMVSALSDLVEGYDLNLAELLTSFPSEAPVGQQSPIVVVRGIAYASLCEHHILPFTGTVSLAYIPSARIVGLSKIPRLVRAYSRRLQVQERLTNQLADSLASLDPVGVMVVAHGRHTCCSIRGAESDAVMVTSAVRGVFATDAMARAEAMGLLGER